MLKNEIVAHAACLKAFRSRRSLKTRRGLIFTKVIDHQIALKKVKDKIIRFITRTNAILVKPLVFVYESEGGGGGYWFQSLALTSYILFFVDTAKLCFR